MLRLLLCNRISIYILYIITIYIYLLSLSDWYEHNCWGKFIHVLLPQHPQEKQNDDHLAERSIVDRFQLSSILHWTQVNVLLCGTTY